MRWIGMCLTLSVLCCNQSKRTPDFNLEVKGAFVRATPPGANNSAAFMTLRNLGPTPLEVVSATSPAASVVELHTHVHEGGVAKMLQVEGLAVEAGQSRELQPGGDHIMLIGLHEALSPSTTVDITLHIRGGQTVTVKAPVRATAPSTQPASRPSSQPALQPSSQPSAASRPAPGGH